MFLRGNPQLANSSSAFSHGRLDPLSLRGPPFLSFGSIASAGAGITCALLLSSPPPPPFGWMMPHLPLRAQCFSSGIHPKKCSTFFSTLRNLKQTFWKVAGRRIKHLLAIQKTFYWSLLLWALCAFAPLPCLLGCAIQGEGDSLNPLVYKPIDPEIGEGGSDRKKPC